MIRFLFAISSSVERVSPSIHNPGRLPRTSTNLPIAYSQPLPLRGSCSSSQHKSQLSPKQDDSTWDRSHSINGNRTKWFYSMNGRIICFLRASCLLVRVPGLGSPSAQEVACSVCFCVLRHWVSMVTTAFGTGQVPR